MPLPRHRLDLVIAVAPPDRALAPSAVCELGVARGWWRADGQAGTHAAALVVGGFAALRAETTALPRFVANRLGGFRVTCPDAGGSVAHVLHRAMAAWRAGGPRVLAPCPVCGGEHTLEELAYAPSAAFARTTWTLVDAQSAALSEDARAALAGVAGDLRVIAVRPG